MSPDLSFFLDKLDFAMVIVTATAGDHASGCLVGFVTQCSIDPVRLFVCISQKNHTHGIAMESAGLAVHLIPADRTDLVDLFGSHSGDDIDKFSRCRWSAGSDGVPLLDGCPSRLVCRVLERRSVGDHTAFLVEPVEAQAAEEPIYMFSMAKDQSVEPGQPP